MHFQIPPYEHTKIVTCISGHAFDVVMDLRRKCSTYGQSVTFDLRGNNGRGVLVAPGLAPGNSLDERSSHVANKESHNLPA